MSAKAESYQASASWISRWTTIEELKLRLIDSPSAGISAWVRTTAGAVTVLLALQIISGLLLAFYYVPTTENAYTTVAFIEKVISGGPWIRSLHYHTSQWLPVALILHLTQLITRRVYLRLRLAWVISLSLLALTLAAAASGYVLPWDVRSISGANIGAGIVGGLPAIGPTLRHWLLDGNQLTTLTLSRFYGLHVLFTPALLLTCIVTRLFLVRDKTLTERSAIQNWLRQHLARNAVVAGLVFMAAAIVAFKFPAPLGPPATEANDYLPRPGPQFLWLFESLKYLPASFASIAVSVLPAAWLGILAAAPWLAVRKFSAVQTLAHRVVLLLFACGFGGSAFLIALACYQDSRDPEVQTKLAQQNEAEMHFRAAPFKAIRVENNNEQSKSPTRNGGIDSANLSQANFVVNAVPPPTVYSEQCAKCHGARGEGAPGYDGLIGVTTREEERRTISDLIAILNNPRAFGLQPKMRSFADKLSDADKREIAEWIATLK